MEGPSARKTEFFFLWPNVYIFSMFCMQGLVFIYITTNPDPDMRRYESEKFFIDPNSDDKKMPFPSLSNDATLELSVIVPSYNEEKRCKLPISLALTK